MMAITRSAISLPGTLPREGMVHVPGGTFLMGSNEFYPEERPVHRATVDAFWMDAHPVTNSEFGRFVRETGYATIAERAPDPAHYPGVDPALLVPGSLIFRQPRRPVPLHDPRAWWAYVPGACWHSPEGPGSTFEGRERHPVVHMVWADAVAYAEWAGKALPTEAEWEFAARGGLEGATYVWGDEFMPRGRRMANTWQGEFPSENRSPGGRVGTMPVESFPPNGFGLFDMAGNVWEWTSDFFAPHHPASLEKACCTPRNNPRVASPARSYATRYPDEQIPRRVLKGGSHLCAPNYCLRYRPAARQGGAVDTSASHIGFRCIVRPGPR